VVSRKPRAGEPLSFLQLGYRLTPSAQQDIDRITDFIAED
jgi:hypothetical protein